MCLINKVRDIEVSMPDFVNAHSMLNNSLVSGVGTHPSHMNYYYLNAGGKQIVKRILCMYEYHYPHVTYSPGLVSITSLLLHYMAEHEVFAALCLMSSSKEHLIESKSAWELNCSVFIRLLKNYCKSAYDTIGKYATDPPEAIFNEWYWWIFDCLSFEYLVSLIFVLKIVHLSNF
jgi:hypothetical protein